MKCGLGIVVLATTALFGCDDEPVLKPFTSAAGRFRVSMPGEPKETQQVVPTSVGEVTAHNFSIEDPNGVYVASFADYPADVVRGGRTEAMLDGACSGMVTNIKGTMLEKENITQDGYPGRQSRFSVPLPGTNTKGFGRARIFLVKGRLYQVFVIGVESKVMSPTSDEFLRSFKFQTGRRGSTKPAEGPASN